MKNEYEIDIRWRAFPLHPETPDQGITLEELFAGRFIDVDAMMDRLKKTAADLGLPFGDRKKTFNSRLAQELGLWAEAEGKGDLFHLLAFEAYFVHGRNLAARDVLLDLAAQAGLSQEEAGAVLDQRRFREAVDRDWDRSRERRISGVPAFLMGSEILVGAQPYKVLAAMAERNGAVRKTALK